MRRKYWCGFLTLVLGTCGLFFTARPAAAQVLGSSVYDPWTGKVYQGVAGYNPYIGQFGQGSGYYNPWNGRL